MSYWLREIAGWLLVVIGLYVFFICFAFLTDAKRSWLMEAVPMTLIGIIIFRGGIHILKVAVAARMAAQAQAAVAAQETATRSPRAPAQSPRAQAAGRGAGRPTPRP